MSSLELINCIIFCYLFARQVYPSTIYEIRRLFDLQVPYCRSEQLRKYVWDLINQASTLEVKKLTVSIIDEASGKTLEKLDIEFYKRIENATFDKVVVRSLLARILHLSLPDFVNDVRFSLSFEAITSTEELESPNSAWVRVDSSLDAKANVIYPIGALRASYGHDALPILQVHLAICR